jgi:uncharacterized membrane protein YhhN
MDFLTKYGFYIPYLLVLAIHLFATSNKNQKWIILSKPLLLIYLLCAYLSFSSMLNGWILLAIISGLLGDVFLLYPDKKPLFLAGLTSFLIGHISYTIAFITLSKIFSRWNPLYLLIAIPFSIYVVMFLKYLNPYTDKMKIPVFSYGVIIAIMGMGSMSFLLIDGKISSFIPIIGALLFILSDSAIALKLFAKRKITDEFVMITYGLAQWILVGWFLYFQALQK